jgi:hypothetical protein
MKRKIIVRVVAAVVVAVFVAGTWLTNGKVDLAWARFFSAAVLVTSLILGVWDVWLWRLPAVQRIPGVPRRIRGTWQGTLRSYWIDPATGQPLPPKKVYLVVHQTATLISVKLFTNESRSTSTIADVSTVDGLSVLTYVYLNRPDMRVESRSRMHHGSTTIDVCGRPPSRLHGRYWTDRESKGELEFTKWHKGLADDFAEASRYFTKNAAK